MFLLHIHSILFWTWKKFKQTAGIEPRSLDWKAKVLPLSYKRLLFWTSRIWPNLYSIICCQSSHQSDLTFVKKMTQKKSGGDRLVAQPISPARTSNSSKYKSTGRQPIPESDLTFGKKSTGRQPIPESDLTFGKKSTGRQPIPESDLTFVKKMTQKKSRGDRLVAQPISPARTSNSSKYKSTGRQGWVSTDRNPLGCRSHLPLTYFRFQWPADIPRDP